MSQIKYTLDILDDTVLTKTKSEKFLMKKNLKLTLIDGDLLHNSTKNHRLVGRLLYLTVIRPYIVYSVRTLSQYMQEPRKTYWDATLWVLKYIKGTPQARIITFL